MLITAALYCCGKRLEPWPERTASWEGWLWPGQGAGPGGGGEGWSWGSVGAVSAPEHLWVLCSAAVGEGSTSGS